MRLQIKISYSPVKWQLDAEEKDTVLQLKQVIEETRNIPKDKQALVFRGLVLKNDKKLGDCGLSEKEEDLQVVTLVIPKEFVPAAPRHESPPPLENLNDDEDEDDDDDDEKEDDDDDDDDEEEDSSESEEEDK